MLFLLDDRRIRIHNTGTNHPDSLLIAIRNIYIWARDRILFRDKESPRKCQDFTFDKNFDKGLILLMEILVMFERFIYTLLLKWTIF